MTRYSPGIRIDFLKASLLLLALCTAGTVLAQPLDKIVAVVGKTRIVLKSDIDMQVESMRTQGGELSDQPECDVMEQMLLQKILVEQAERDSVMVSDEEVEASLENRIRYFIMQYGSKEKVEELSGKTIYQLKDENREVTKEMMLSERMQGTILDAVKVTPVEVQKFYATIPKDSLPFFPATVEMGQIVIDPPVSPELDTYARKKIEDIRRKIVEEGADFETQAGIYSDDPGSRNEGGLMKGISRKGGQLVTEFAVAAFKLQNGEISPVIRTRFGYHIIQMVSRKGDEADVRHILVKPELTSIDFNKALAKLDSVRTELVEGKITFEQAVGKYSTDEMANRTGGMIADQQGGTILEVEDLDPTLALMLDTLKPGMYSKPMVYTNMRGERSCRIVYMKSLSDPHKANLKDDYSRIQFAALQKKKGQRMQEWVRDKAPTYFIKLDPEYKQCPNLQAYIESSAKK
ncbi:MAG: peptidylprolyl isomerase [Chitinophagaceae bacterium]|nr:peptidylprolyl isomerase [Chitinophagaceae bacterium]MCB9045433.1 peptidylprolyl isomerase [Chitinophagales bacterium]